MTNLNRLSFSIRDLLWLMTIAALSIGWFVNWATSTTQFERLQREHLELLTKQSDGSVVGMQEKVNQMRVRSEYDRLFMEEQTKALQEGAEFSYRYLQELKRVREEKAQQQAVEGANAEAARSD